MKARKPVPNPVQDGPVKAKPGDIEPPPDTKGVTIVEPPQGSPTPEATVARSQRGPKDSMRH